MRVQPITEDQFERVLPLIAGYQRFYGVRQPEDDRNRRFFRRFLAPSEDGLLLGAWDDDELVGFATLYWTFSSTHAAEIVLMNDLFVSETHRGRGIGQALIEESLKVARKRGTRHLEWMTAEDNLVAQRLYDRIGASKDTWIGYELMAGEG
jgi:GNAT superfamily N-acetyltransferase